MDVSAASGSAVALLAAGLRQLTAATLEAAGWWDGQQPATPHASDHTRAGRALSPAEQARADGAGSAAPLPSLPGGLASMADDLASSDWQSASMPARAASERKLFGSLVAGPSAGSRHPAVAENPAAQPSPAGSRGDGGRQQQPAAGPVQQRDDPAVAKRSSLTGHVANPAASTKLQADVSQVGEPKPTAQQPLPELAVLGTAKPPPAREAVGAGETTREQHNTAPAMLAVAATLAACTAAALGLAWRWYSLTAVGACCPVTPCSLVPHPCTAHHVHLSAPLPIVTSRAITRPPPV